MASPSFFETIDALLTLFGMTHATTCGRYIAVSQELNERGVKSCPVGDQPTRHKEASQKIDNPERAIC